MKLDRRQLLAGMGLGAALPAQAHAQTSSTGAFQHGVAAGDPAQDGFVLWTRVTVDAADAGPRTVRWTVYEDEALSSVAAEGEFETSGERDHTVKVVASGLRPGHEYRYRFAVGETMSPVGRARTLPQSGSTDPVALAVASCSLHSNGLFNSYDAIAQLERLDAVIHLGDYIYEYGAAETDYGMGNGLRLGRIPDPPHEIVSLEDYRRRHAQYKSDPDLQAAHARAAWIVVFDDHEVTNDPWVEGAQNHQPETEGDWNTRKAVALRAWFEWMPIREPQPGQPLLESIQRSFQFGDVAALHMTETRLTARTRQLRHEDLLTAEGTVNRDILADPERRLLGDAQLAALQQRMTNSAAWQLLGNQIVMARVSVPDVRGLLGDDVLNAALAGIQDERVVRQLRQMVALGALGVPMNLDAWDGYPAERERLYEAVRAANARLVVLAGDSHAGWANALSDALGQPVGIEFGATAITSPSPSYSANLPAGQVSAMLAAANPEVEWCDFDKRGFFLLELAPDQVRCSMRGVSTILEKPYAVAEVAAFTAAAGEGGAIGPLTRA
jgi:alkaline phosphatase D